MATEHHIENVETVVPTVTFSVDGFGIRIDGDALRAVAEKLVRHPNGDYAPGQLQWGQRFDVSTAEGQEKAADWFMNQLLQMAETAVGCDAVELQAA